VRAPQETIGVVSLVAILEYIGSAKGACPSGRQTKACCECPDPKCNSNKMASIWSKWFGHLFCSLHLLDTHRNTIGAYRN
jgi:hypothetical protein